MADWKQVSGALVQIPAGPGINVRSAGQAGNTHRRTGGLPG
ncbi:hypothetical protein ACPXCE_18940 [Streptomyces sp. DT24]